MSATNDATIQVSGGESLDVRSFAVRQRISELFTVEVTAVSKNADIDLDAVIGMPASFSLRGDFASSTWEGVCAQIDQLRTEPGGLSSYQIVIMPRAWLMCQRNNYRIFQMKSELDIVQAMLGEWGVQHEERVDPGAYKPRKYRVQYDETDFAFVNRMLEDAGISYYFENRNGNSIMVLDDAPQASDVSKAAIPFVDSPEVVAGEFVTAVQVTRRVRPGRMTIGDIDYRQPSDRQPRLSASGGLPVEMSLEQFRHEPGAFLYRQESGMQTPVADDRGASRTDPKLGNAKTQHRLHGARSNARQIVFQSNAIDLAPGVTVNIADHPHREVGDRLLITDCAISGECQEHWRASVQAVPTGTPYHPEIKTPRPKVIGIESATVAGPKGEDIHTDEYGRVRVHFHWDRESQRNEESSCWIPSSQPWAGGGFGGINLPRIGQEVLIEFLGGDPDRPMIMGRVYTELQKPPYKLPDHKNVASMRSETTPRLVSGAADGSGTTTPSGSLLDKAGVPEGIPKTQSEIADMATKAGPFQAKSPDAQSHAWSGNELSFHDTNDQQTFYMQAQKDMNIVVKSSMTTIVGNHRATSVGTDDQLEVDNKQQIDIGKDQATSIGRDYTTKVGQNSSHDVTGLYTLTTGEGIKQLSPNAILIRSDKVIRLAVGDSFIDITPTDIIIQAADKVHINPKQGTPEYLAKKKADADADARAASKAAFDAAPPGVKKAYEGYKRSLNDPSFAQTQGGPDQWLNRAEDSAVGAGQDPSNMSQNLNHWADNGF